MKYIRLGTLEVSRIGLGAMGMSAAYTGAGTDEAESIRTIHRALEFGVNFIDTAEVYGPHTNEELVGRAIKGRREHVVLATKFGFMSNTGRSGPDSSPANIRIAIEGSLQRLGTDYVDLYYQHRVDPQTPIEETVGTWLNSLPKAKYAISASLRRGPRPSAAHMLCIRSPRSSPSTPCGLAIRKRYCRCFVNSALAW